MSAPTSTLGDERTGMTLETLRQAVIDHLLFTRAKNIQTAHLVDVYHALAHTVRDRLVYRWMRTSRTYGESDVRRVYYLSAEYLPGRWLATNLHNLGLYEMAREGLAEYGLDLERVLEEEPDPGLGNGGLGRLAACFMDSLATLQLPAWGYGIRYEFGIFRQEIVDGWQVEQPDEWLRNGNPWEIPRHEYAVEVRFGGHVESHMDREDRLCFRWVGGETVLGVPYDTPIAGFGNNTVNTLRLWSARASEEFDLAVFNDGDYRRAVEQKALSESISKVLYPKDNTPEGKELRLRQQYFFVCCSISDIFRRWFKQHDDLTGFADKVRVQLNDTHPSVTVAELMRVLLDTYGLEWEPAWEITRAVCGYTNHTLLPEALERWSLPLFRRLLPRHLQLIFEINHRFLKQVHVRWQGDDEIKRRMSIIEESRPQQIRMAHLAVVGSHSVNGVAALHSDLVQSRLLPDFAALWPERFNNKTNGVTPRRWMLQCNPELSALISEQLGGRGWVTDLDQLEKLAPLAEDPEFLARVAAVKRTKKEALTRYLAQAHEFTVDPDALFDVQVKRIHEYKRQLLKCLHVVHLYRLARFEKREITPRAVFIGGKAAPGYARAKHFIKLIHDVANIVNNDPEVNDRLRFYFLPNYNVSFAERVIPAADLSEQISLAGWEASGTGNMKFQMNGALTVGTLDGANIEIRESVGPDNFFLFGRTAAEVLELRESGYHPAPWIDRSPQLGAALDLIERGFFSPDDPGLHRSVVDHLRHQDTYMIAAEFNDYLKIQDEAGRAFADPERWWPMVVRNIAGSGRFSSDRTIRQYAEDIWGLEPTPVSLEG